MTLVVPVKDNATGVATVLTATGDLAERIVVDDGSILRLPHATVRHPAPDGPAAARNTGWRLAHAKLVALLDADTQPDPGWLDTIVPLFEDPHVAAVAPRVCSRHGTGSIAGYEHDRSSLDMGPDPAPVRPTTRISYVPTAALVVRRAALEAIGGFDENLRYGEDVDLAWRLVAAGDTVRYQPAATVWHTPRPTLRSWLRQRYDYGTSAAPLAHRHPGRLACAALTPSSALTWALAARGRPASALTVAALAATRATRDLCRNGVPTGAALHLVIRAQLTTGGMLTSAVRRTWWPPRCSPAVADARSSSACCPASSQAPTATTGSVGHSCVSPTTSPTAPGCGPAAYATAQSPHSFSGSPSEPDEPRQPTLPKVET